MIQGRYCNIISALQSVISFHSTHTLNGAQIGIIIYVFIRYKERLNLISILSTWHYSLLLVAEHLSWKSSWFYLSHMLNKHSSYIPIWWRFKGLEIVPVWLLAHQFCCRPYHHAQDYTVSLCPSDPQVLTRNAFSNKYNLYTVRPVHCCV